jgi:SAM-dependent methyltransferase
MNTEDEIKNIVKSKYSDIAIGSLQSCCSSSNCCGDNSLETYTIFQDDYSKLNGYVKDADLGLGCGIPTEFAAIKEGDKVVDLGSGAGNDVFVAQKLVGETGEVIGIDMTEEMIKVANANLSKLGYKNVKFILGEIESIPLNSNSTDVVISNCVLNLVPNKLQAFKEIFRILKSGGHFCISDVVTIGELPTELLKSATLYAGCVSGALDKEEYLNIIKEAGFTNIEIKKSKKIELPDNLILQHIQESKLVEFKTNFKGLYSITVVANKP